MIINNERKDIGNNLSRYGNLIEHVNVIRLLFYLFEIIIIQLNVHYSNYP